MYLILWLGCREAPVQEKPNTIEDSAVVPNCLETGGGALPEDVEWIVLDGNSQSTFTLAQDVLSCNWNGNYGTYDLNTVAFEGGNGFLLERPGVVVGAMAQWGNLPLEQEPVDLVFWPDFGSNGYSWDRGNPYAVVSKCLSTEDDGEWVEYVLEAPVEISQPQHVLVGYTRAERESGTISTTPELYQEDHQEDSEPYYSGAWFLGVEDELYQDGMSQPWYTWRVRLAVVYDEPIEEDSRPFQHAVDFEASSRGSWGDFDNDGDDDLMLNGPYLYQNNGDGSFVDVTDVSVLTDLGTGGGVWGDFDNDGCLDYFGQSSQDILLRNSCNEDGAGYVLSDVTTASGLNDLQSDRDCDGNGEQEHSPTEGSAWIDVDNDGWLDLYLANYECSSEFDYFKNYDDRLWRNNGDGTFSDWTENAGIPSSNHAGRGATVIDFDLDGDQDLFVSNYRLDPNFFLINNGDGTMTDRAGPLGVRGENVGGAYGHTIGSVFGDIDNDGDFDLIQANLAHPFFYWFSDKTAVLINDDGHFTDEASSRGIYYRETHSNPTLFDSDNDGDLDLFVSSIYSSRDSDFYLNNGLGSFELSNYQQGLVVKNGWGSCASDVDNDGDVDIFVRSLFKNESNTNSHWLEVRIVGGIVGGPADQWGDWRGNSNVSAIGAVVEVHTADAVQMRHVSGGSGTGVQDSLSLHFGLGAEHEVELIRVYFSGGAQVELSEIASNQKIWIHEDGTHRNGFAFPEDLFPQQLAQ